jgi:hypothetical protein
MAGRFGLPEVMFHIDCHADRSQKIRLMSEMTWQGIVDEMQASGWGVALTFDSESGLWQAEAIHPADGKRYVRRDPNQCAAIADLHAITRGKLGAGMTFR